MTLDQFFTKLEAVKDQYEWRLTPDGKIRALAKEREVDHFSFDCLCPISCVHRAECPDKITDNDHWNSMFRELGMNYKDALDIVMSADYPDPDKCRSALLNIVGLKENK
jgi:hypothetical protein